MVAPKLALLRVMDVSGTKPPELVSNGEVNRCFGALFILSTSSAGKLLFEEIPRSLLSEVREEPAMLNVLNELKVCIGIWGAYMIHRYIVVSAFFTSIGSILLLGQQQQRRASSYRVLH